MKLRLTPALEEEPIIEWSVVTDIGRRTILDDLEKLPVLIKQAL